VVVIIWYLDLQLQCLQDIMILDKYMLDNNIMLRRAVLLMEKTEVPRENNRPVASHWQTLSHNVVSSTPGNTHKCLVLYYIVLSFLFINLYSFVLFMMLLSVSMLRRATSSL
jgi:hypothetical protein